MYEKLWELKVLESASLDGWTWDKLESGKWDEKSVEKNELSIQMKPHE